MSNKYPTATNLRRKELAQIHMAAEQLGLDTGDKDESSAYRSMLWTLARVRSASALDWAGRKKVLDHLKSCGAKLGFAGKPANVRPELIPLMSKIGALLADMKLPWKYATVILKRQAKVERLEWANAAQLHDVATALTVRQAKIKPIPSPVQGEG